MSSRDQELYELVKASGITIDTQVFRVLLDLLKLDVSPIALYEVLHNMASQSTNSTLVQKKNLQNKSSGTPHHTPEKKKPPVAAKPKKIRVDNSNAAF